MGNKRNSKETNSARVGIRKRRPASLALVASLVVSAVLAVSVLILTVSGGPGQLLPHAGDRIDASFAGLRDTSGAVVQEHALARRYRLVTFGFTTCADVCPLTLLGIHQALDQLGPDAARIFPVFVSVDPERDTPPALLAYVNAFDSRIVALTGSLDAVEQVAQRYRVYVDRRPFDAQSKSYVVDHSALVLLVDPQQRIRAAIPSTGPPAVIAASIVRAVRGRLDAGV